MTETTGGPDQIIAWLNGPCLMPIPSARLTTVLFGAMTTN